MLHKISWQKDLSALFVISLFFIAVHSWGASPFVLVENGVPQAVVLKNQKVEAAVRFFNEEVKKCIGAVFPLVESRDAEKQNIIFTVSEADLESDDAFSIDFPDARTMLITCSPRSARWAVNHILQTVFNVRWLFVDLPETYRGEINEYPPQKDVSMQAEKYTQGAYSFWIYRAVDWRARGWDYRWDVKVPFMGSHFIPVDVFPVWKYAAEQSWPVEIMPVLNGKKYLPPKATAPLSDNPYLAKKGYDVHWNPCFTNPKTTEIAIANILEILAANPDKIEIAMGLNDNGGMCQCESCLREVGKKRNSGGYADWSEPYWRWVDNVARAVSEKYPKVFFVCSAYREAMDPPSFVLHPRVVVKTCFELAAMNEPEVYASRMDIMREWAKKARHIQFYDYSYGLGSFLLPRIYFKSHSQIMKELYHNYNVRGMFAEASIRTPFEGPKQYLMFELMRNIDADPEKIVMQWCVDAVGEQAAPYLRSYYQFWEDYWTGSAIKKTRWYSTHRKIYMQLGERSTHLFALQKGDMDKLRGLMENVVANAATPSQKKRAEFLMGIFAFSECAAKAVLAEYIDPDGVIKTANDAVALLRQVPAAVAAIQEIENNPFAKHGASGKGLIGNLIANIGVVLPFVDAPSVQEEIKKLAQEQSIPILIRGQFKIWLGQQAVNMVQNGSFEEEQPLPTGWAGGALVGRRTDALAADGKYSLGGTSLSVEYSFPIVHGKTYMVMLDAHANKGSSEGRFNYMLSPRKGTTPLGHIRFLDITLPGELWQTFSGATTITAKNCDNLLLNIFVRKYEPDEAVHIDNVRLFCIDDLEDN